MGARGDRHPVMLAHLEFTLIGDTTNVASRVEQLTKTTGDPILLRHQTVEALAFRSHELTDRGAHRLKGKSTVVEVSASTRTVRRTD